MDLSKSAKWRKMLARLRANERIVRVLDVLGRFEEVHYICLIRLHIVEYLFDVVKLFVHNESANYATFEQQSRQIHQNRQAGPIDVLAGPDAQTLSLNKFLQIARQ